MKAKLKYIKEKITTLQNALKEACKDLEDSAKEYDKIEETQKKLSKIIENELNNILQETQEELKTFIEILPDILLRIDEQGNILHLHLPENTTFTKEKLKKIEDLGFAENHYQKILNYVKDLFEMKEGKFILKLKANDQKYAYQVELKKRKYTEEVFILLRDILQEEKSYQTIFAAEQRWKDLLRNIPDMVSIIDKNLDILFINNTENYDYHNEDIVETNILRYLDSMYHEEFRNKIQSVFKENKVIQYEYPFYGKHEPNKKIWFATIVTPLLENEQKTDRAVLISRDITQRKLEEQELKEVNQELFEKDEELSLINEELEAMNEKLIKNQDRLEMTVTELENRNLELDSLVYKMSHDIRSPLATLRGILQLSKESKDVDELHNYIDLMENRASKLDSFIKSMLIYARSQRVESEPKEIDFQGLIKEVLKDLSHRDNFDNVQINTKLEIEDTAFLGDPLRMHIIFSNIISNAIKYQNLHQEQSFLDIHIFKKGDKLYIHFKDNGIGISEEHLPKIYDMFYRATQTSEGSGLGLYIVKQSVDKSEGNITLSSAEGKGTEIKISFLFKEPKKTPSLEEKPL